MKTNIKIQLKPLSCQDDSDKLQDIKQAREPSEQ